MAYCSNCSIISKPINLIVRFGSINKGYYYYYCFEQQRTCDICRCNRRTVSLCNSETHDALGEELWGNSSQYQYHIRYFCYSTHTHTHTPRYMRRPVTMHRDKQTKNSSKVQMYWGEKHKHKKKTPFHLQHPNIKSPQTHRHTTTCLHSMC